MNCMNVMCGSIIKAKFHQEALCCVDYAVLPAITMPVYKIWEMRIIWNTNLCVTSFACKN
jgi:hypothetical protein